MVRKAIHELFEGVAGHQGENADHWLLDRLLEMVSHRLGGDVEECPGCSELPLAVDPVCKTW